jgi:ribosomal protein S18 acetylase RimI-like enzyme
MNEKFFKLDVYEKRPEVTLRDAREEDAPFLAKCVMAGMHFYDFEEEMTPEAAAIYERLVACERRTDLLYSYVHTRVAEVNGVPAGSLLAYPGEPYKELRHKTFAECWPDLASLDTESEMETGPGEYYLDTLAVVPAYRKHGIGHRLLEDAIGRGRALGYGRIALVADPQYPHLLELYASLGFEPEEKRRVFGVDFQRMVIECGTSSVD